MARSNLANTKTRSLVMVVGAILLIGIAIAVTRSGDSGPAKTAADSKTTEVPRNVQSTPGEKVTPNYAKLQQQANKRGAEEAAQRGETFIPTLTGVAEGYDDTAFDQQFANDFDDLGGKCSKKTINELKAQGLAISDIILRLKKMGCSSAALAALFDPDELAAALLAAGDCKKCTAEDAKALRAEGKTAAEIVAEFTERGCPPEDITASLENAGFSANEISSALANADLNSNTTAGCGPNAVKKLQAEGKNAKEIAEILKQNGCDASDTAKALKAAGYSAAEVAQALKASGYDRAAILGALNEAGYDPVEITAASTAIDFDDANLAALFAQQRKQAEEAEELARRQAAALEAERLANFSEQRRQIIQELSGYMETQSEAALASWNNFPQQSFVRGALATETAEEGSGSGDAGSPGATTSSKDIIHKAGTIFFAVLETAVNSDEPGPVMAQIVAGPLKGSRLIGSMTSSQEAEKITLNFSTINIPSEESSMGISAIAIDPDTARTALASDVDHHYILRWGSLFGSAFMEGYASAVASAGETETTITDPSGGVTTTSTSPPLDGRQQLFEGLASVGAKWSEVVGDNFDRPFTITIDQGTSIGILLTADLEHGTPPGTPAGTPAIPTGLPTAASLPAATQGFTAEQTASLLNALQASSSTVASTIPTTQSQSGGNN